MSSVRDAFAEALGALLALGMNPEAQVFFWCKVCILFPTISKHFSFTRFNLKEKVT